MDLFYKGNKVKLETTDVIGGIRVYYNNEERLLSRQGRHGNVNFTDIHRLIDEIKLSIDHSEGNILDLDNIPTYSPCIRLV